MILRLEKRWNAHHFPSGNPDCSSSPSLILVTAPWGGEARGVGLPSSSYLGGALPGQQMKGNQRAACSQPVILIVKKKSGIQGSSKYFSLNQTLATVGS